MNINKTAAGLACLFVGTILAFGAFTLYQKLDAFSGRVARIETETMLLGWAVSSRELKHESELGDARLVNYVPVETFKRYQNGLWEKIGGDSLNGSWPANAAAKTKALAVYKDELCIGTLATDAAEAQVWCYDRKQWRQIGGNGVNHSWVRKEYVPFLEYFDGKLFAGVDHEIWAWDGKRWSLVGGMGDCISYSTEPFEGALYFGTNNCGLRTFRYADHRFGEFALTDSARLARLSKRYVGIYTMTALADRMYIGTIARPGSAAVFEFTRAGGLEKVGGDGINNSWVNPGFNTIETLTTAGGCLVATMNRAPMTEQAITPVWCYRDGIWRPIARQTFPELWARQVEYYSGASPDGVLIVGSGAIEPGLATVWALSPQNAFVMIGGFGINGSWGSPLDNRMIDQWPWLRYLTRARPAEYPYRIKPWGDDLVVTFGAGAGLGQVWLFRPQPWLPRTHASGLAAAKK
jgi:hypothetical protein